MLRITMNKSASGAKKYYCEQYYKEGQFAQHDYYAESNEAIGRWGGDAARMLGLSGDVCKQDFARLCDNINPVTSKKLTGRNDTDRTVGYDFTFNASKSVSLAYTFASEEDKKIILAAFQQSVRETMTDIERGMQARVRVKGKNENRLTSNIAYGAFTHFTTRPIDGVPDPHLHSHCFVFNATFDQEEQKWKAGHFLQLKQDAPYYEAMFHSRLARHLQSLGYRIERTQNGFELAGVDKQTLDKFSRRTQEIEEYSREHNITDEKQKSQVGAKTREAKRPPVSADRQETAWRNRLMADELAALANLKQSGRMAYDDKAAREAIQAALSHHLERKSVVSDKEVLATAVKSSIGQATPEQVRQAFTSDAAILAVNEQLRTLITTKDAVKEEKQLIRRCIEAKNRYRPINERYEPQNALLNDQQRRAVQHALSSTDGITIITGKAGTGKTTLMKEVQAGILASGKRIFAFAPSSEASRGVQRSEGFENADTVARLITDSSTHADLKNQVVWIDEAGMLSNKDMNKILAIADAQSARVILSGDTRQHTSVERGDALRILQQEAGIKPVTVDKIQRQQNNAYKEAVASLSDGKVERGFKQLDRMGAIHEIADSSERIHTIAKDYYQSAYGTGIYRTKNVLVVAPTHAEGDLVSNEIRQTLKAHDVIGQDDHNYTVLHNRQLTEAEKQQPENYRNGDVLAFFQNSKGIKAGKRLTVTEAGEHGLFAQAQDEQPMQIALTEAKKFNVYEPKEIDVAQGDKIRLTANGKSKDHRHLFNGSTFYVEGFDQDGSMRLSNGATLSPEFGHFQHGYVSTSHAAQGKTADKVIISQSSATFRASSMEQFYVSVSRGKEAVSIYTDDKEHLQQAVSQSAERTTASELMNKHREQQAQEINRRSQFNQQQSPANGYNYSPTQIKNDGLQGTARTEQEAAR